MKTLLVSQLKEGMTVANNVYSAADSFVPVITKNTVLTERIIKRIIDQKIQSVQIVTDDVEPEIPAIEPDLPLFEREPIIIQRKPALVPEELQEKALDSIENLFSLFAAADPQETMTSAYQVVKQLDNVVDHLVDTLVVNQKELIDITNLRSYDEYTYHHSLSVAILSIAIGQNLGFTQKQLNDVARCAIMHDIGKASIPLEIINKPSRLSESEFAQIKGHSQKGFSFLIDSKISDDEICYSVLHHHEKVDGTGYPSGLKMNQIPVMSRIISIADVYDALTSNRPYRTPVRAPEAVEFIMGNVGSSFDYDIVKAFLPRLDLYPVGDMVELSNGRIAVVLNNQNTMRPIVQILETGETLDLFLDKQCMNLTIKSILDRTAPGSGK